MSSRRHMLTTFVALALAAIGFLAAGAGSAWWVRDLRTKPWRKLRVEHEGLDGVTTRTRVIFDNPKVALSGVEVIRDPDGVPELGRIEVRGGAELTVKFEAGRPASLASPDGARATFTYNGTRALVTFINADGKQAGSKDLRVPVELRSALELAEAESWSLINEAHAQETPQVTVTREVRLDLEIRMSGKGGTPGEVRIEASCPSFTCLPLTPTVKMPGQARVRIGVTGTAKRGAAPAGKQALERFKEQAADEGATANRALPDVAAVVAAAGMTAAACKTMNLSWPICVGRFSRSAIAGDAINSITSHSVPTSGRALDPRATALHYQEQARDKLDKTTKIKVCLSRSGYTRKCTSITGRPLGAQPLPVVTGNIELKRGISGTIEGDFVMTQSDGADCKFSPSPKTVGPLRLKFDGKTGVVTGTLNGSGRGTRSGLSCSLGRGDMRWSQNYSATVTQSFSLEQLQGGGTLDLRLTGTMSGTGSSSQSNCRRRGGGSVQCPAGKNNSYSNPIRVIGTLDLDSQKGNGRIEVSNAPLSTRGTWRIPSTGGGQ